MPARSSSPRQSLEARFIALGFSIYSERKTRQAPDERRTFGYGRMDALLKVEQIARSRRIQHSTVQPVYTEETLQRFCKT